MTMGGEQDWRELAALWGQDPEPEDPGLIRQLRRAAMRSRLVFAGEAAVSVAGLAAAAWLAWRGDALLAVTVAVYSLFGLGLSYQTRSAAWRVDSGDVASALGRQVLQAEAALKAARLGLYICAAALVMIAVFAGQAALQPSPPAEQVRRLLTVVAISIAAIAAVVVVSAVRIEKARARLERLRNLQDEDADRT